MSELSLAPRGRADLYLALVGLALLALVLLGPTLHRQAGDLAFGALALLQGGLVIWSLCLAARIGDRRALWIILGIAVALRLALLFVHPHLSSDAFRYVWDGRVQGEGINPYRYVPAAPELAHLRDAAIYPFINRAGYAVTIYPPAAEILFFLVGRIADGLVALKLAYFAFEAVTALVLLDLLRRIGQPATRIVTYAWHPLAVWEIAGSAHIDAAMLSLMALGIWLAVESRRLVLAAAVIAVAAMMKPLAALALPIAWKPWDWRAPVAAIATVVLLYIPYLSVGTGMFAFVGGYVQEEALASGEAFWPVWLVTTLLGPVPGLRTAYLLAAAALVLALAFRLAFAVEDDAETRLRRLSWLVFAGVYALSPGYPWYYLCLLPFLVLFGSPHLWAATLAGYLLYDEVQGDPQIAFWIRDGAMNLAVIGALLWTAWRSKTRRPVVGVG
ncbi:hypothetical protein [Roseococcus sp.]|uniref:hypothetical protein n=1 Tax=Roseococcus sp. TaxID=2109646 RepID=UPI003BAAA1FA